MKIDISSLKDGDHLDVEHNYDPKALAIEQDDLHYVAPLELKGALERVKDSLIFKGALKSRIEIVCARCLNTVQKDINEAFDFFYTIKNEKDIDATNEIRETMVLSYPVKILCKENCRGLCQSCGADLNKGSCSCSENDTLRG